MIDDTIIAGRIPRLGTITVGRGVEATSRSGGTYARPTRTEGFVFHTNDPEVATAIQTRYGGDVLTDSPTWGFDVVVDASEVEVVAFASGFRQNLESWRAAECLRRCDGVTMSTESGRPVSQPCACEPEMARGQDRACKPSTILPVLIDLDVERFGVWEVRSGSWGTAAAIKGAIQALALVGMSASSVPAILSTVQRSTRDHQGKVHDVTEIRLTIAQSQQALAALARAGTSGALAGAQVQAALPIGEDARRVALMTEWSDLQARGHRLGLREQLVADWREMFGPGRTWEDLDVADLDAWVSAVRGTVEDAEQIIRAEQDEAAGSRESDAEPPRDVPLPTEP
jgi:hypothetical protein